VNKDLKIIAIETLKILIKKSWSNLSIKQIKVKSRVKLFSNLIKNKQELLNNINSYFDYNLILNSKKIENSKSKDMIFEILMMRFDLLQDNRKAILSIFKSFRSNPKELVFMIPKLLISVETMLNCVKISSKGIVGKIKIKGILIIYLTTFLVWIGDETESLEKTMTFLDNSLDQIEKLFKL
jgi:ubiquinone biosynthesis protein COQ9